MSVLVDGSTFASLIYSHSNSPGNQEGILLGQIVRRVKDHISDSQISAAQVQTYIYVSSHLPWTKEDPVYTRGGMPIMEKLAALLGDHREEVVGWYSFRRNSSLRISMKEHTLHNFLADTLFSQAPDDFLFFLTVAMATSDLSTYTIDHCFMKRTGRNLCKVPMTILNLGDTVHTEYKTHGNACIAQSASLKHILNQHQSKFVSSFDLKMLEVKRIDDISTAMSADLMKLCIRVAESERQTEKLEEEIYHLQHLLCQKERVQQTSETEMFSDVNDTDEEMPFEDEENLHPNQVSSKGKGFLYSSLNFSGNMKDVTLMQDNQSITCTKNNTVPAGNEYIQIPMKNRDKTANTVSSTKLDELIFTSAPSMTTEGLENQCPQVSKSLDVAKVSSAFRPLKQDPHINTLEYVPSVVNSSTLENKSSTGEKKSENILIKTENPSLAQSKPNDHFSFVDTIITSEYETAASKNITMPPSAEVTSRITRSKAKSETEKNSERDKLWMWKPALNVVGSTSSQQPPNSCKSSNKSMDNSASGMSVHVADVSTNAVDSVDLTSVPLNSSSVENVTAESVNKQTKRNTQELNPTTMDDSKKLDPKSFLLGTNISITHQNKKTFGKNSEACLEENGADIAEETNGPNENVIKSDVRLSPIF